MVRNTEQMTLELNMEELIPVQEAIAANHMDLARNLLRVLIEKYPDDADVWYWAAQAAVNDTQRKAFLEKAVTLDPLHHQAANELYEIDNGLHPRVMPQQLSLEKEEKSGIHYAAFSRRAIATLIDLVLLGIILYPIIISIIAIIDPATNLQASIQGMMSDSASFALTFCLISIGQALYYGYFLSQHKGQTPGKRLLRIRVIKQDGSKITIWQAILRNVIGYQLSNVVPGIGFLWMLSDGQSRTWHDMISQTIVVDVE